MARFPVPLFLLFATSLLAQTPPRIGPELPVNDPQLAPALGNQSSGAIASDGNDFYVAWQDTRGGGAILGTKITSAGDISNKVGDVLSDTPGDRAFNEYGNDFLESPPRVEWDGSAYFVTWATKDGLSHFSRVDRDGVIIQRDTRVPGASLATNGRDVLAASSTGDVVYIRLYSRAGTAIGNDIAVSIAHGPVTGCGGYSVESVFARGGAFASANFLLFIGEAGPCHLSNPTWLVNVDSSGNPGAPIAAGPSVAWNGSSALTVTTESLTGGVVRLDGTRGDPLKVGMGSAVWNGAEYVAVTTGPSGSLVLMRISSDGKLIDSTNLTGVAPSGSIMIGSNGTRNLVTFSRTKDPVFQHSDLFARFTDDFASEFVVAWSPRPQKNPLAASNGKELMVSWSERGEIAPVTSLAYLSRVLQNGEHLDGRGAPLNVSAVVSLASDRESFVAISDPILHIAPNAVVDQMWTQMRGFPLFGPAAFGAGEYMIAGRYGIGACVLRLQSDGAPIDTFPIDISPFVGIAPDIVWDGREFFMAWQDSENRFASVPPDPPSRIVGALVSPGGTDLHAFYIASGNTAKTQVALATNEETVFVVYKNSAESENGLIYGKLMSRDGDVLVGGSADGFAISASAGQYPAIAWDGAAYVVVWASSDGIFMRRFDRSGHEIDAQPVVITRVFSAAAKPRVVAIGSRTAVVYTREDESGTWFGVAHTVVRFVSEALARARSIR